MQSRLSPVRRVALTLSGNMNIKFLSENLRPFHSHVARPDLTRDLAGISTVLERTVSDSSPVRTFILNRPKALHALNTEMISAMYDRLRSFEVSNKVKCVIISSQGTENRALCAGGDVRSLYYRGKENDFAAIDDFFRTEYSLNSLIASLRKTTVISVLDGIVMGGGVGLVVYGKYRIATENTVLAMPECAIGLHPDVGASYFLSRLPSGYGMYMALTGARLTGEDVVSAGFATHFIHSESIPEVVDFLQTSNNPDDSTILETLSRFETMVSTASSLPGAKVVGEAFTHGSVEEIEGSLENIACRGANIDSEFAESALQGLRDKCPASLKVAHESLTRGKDLTLDECLKSEFRLTTRFVRRHDFYAGVGSVLVTKDRNPAWRPAKLSQVSANDVEQFFGPLDADIKIPELDLAHWNGHETDNAFPNARM